MPADMLCFLLGVILGYLGRTDYAHGQRLWDALVFAHRGHIGSRGLIQIGPIHVDLSDSRALAAIAEILDLSDNYDEFLRKGGQR